MSQQSVPDSMASAVELPTMDTPPEDPTPTDSAREFQVSIVGDLRGRPHVMLAFGHLQWLFEPGLASDLGSVLVDAAKQARDLPPIAPDMTPMSLPAERL